MLLSAIIPVKRAQGGIRIEGKMLDGGAAWLRDGSCMSREAHVQFCESLGVRFPGATHPSRGIECR